MRKDGPTGKGGTDPHGGRATEGAWEEVEEEEGKNKRNAWIHQSRDVHGVKTNASDDGMWWWLTPMHDYEHGCH